MDSIFTEWLCRGISRRILRSLFLVEVIVKLSYRVKKVNINAAHDREESIMLTSTLQIFIEFTEFSAQSTSAESNRAAELIV